MYKLSSENTTYMISLDGLDLNYLKTHHDPQTSVPLWSIPNKEDFYEFKVNAWRMPLSDDEEDLEEQSSESQICPICNINVPLIYTKEHNNSTQHKNMRKIFKLALLRGKNSDLSNSSEGVGIANTYYCENCSMAVLKTNKNTHEESYTHKKSVRNTDLIKQFTELYSEDSYKTDIKIPNLQSYFNKCINRKNLSFQISVINEDYVNVDVRGHAVKMEINHFHGFMRTEDELICILCEVQIGRANKLMEEHIESKKHRKKIAKTITDENCLREINDEFVHCMLCNELVLLYRIAGHKMMSYHTFNLKLALSKNAFNKKLIHYKENNNVSNKNYLIDELSDHEDDVESQEEEDMSDSEHVFEEIHNYNTTQVTNKTFCNTCSVYIDTHNFESHKLGSIHKQLEFSKNVMDDNTFRKIRNYVYQNVGTELVNRHDISEPVVENDINQSIGDVSDHSDDSTNCALDNNQNVIAHKDVQIKETSTVKEIDEYTVQTIEVSYICTSDTEPIEIPSDFIDKVNYQILVTTTDNEIVCKVCNILMLNTDLNIYKHFDGDIHATTYRELLKKNRLTKAQNKLFCYACKVSITSKNELEHIFGNRHKNNFPTDINATSIYCELCKVHISDSIQDHQISDLHVKFCIPNDNDIQSQTIEQTNTEDNISNEYVQFSDDKCKQSSDTENAQASEIASNSQTTVVAETDDNRAVFLKPYYHVTKSPNPSEVQCKICNVTLTNSIINIDSHIIGFNHTNKYKILLDSNGVIKEDGRFYCDFCDVYICNKNEIEHIFGYKHKNKLPKDNESANNVLCEVCDLNIPSYYMERHLEEADHFKNVLLKQVKAEFDSLNSRLAEISEKYKSLQVRTARLSYQQSGRR